MNKQIVISRKLDKVTELLSEIQALMINSESEPPKRSDVKIYFFNVEKMRAFFDMDSPGEKWMTCAEICEEIGEEPSLTKCRSAGQYLSSIGVKYRRSNGKNQWLMPPLESF